MQALKFILFSKFSVIVPFHPLVMSIVGAMALFPSNPRPQQLWCRLLHIRADSATGRAYGQYVQ